MVEIISGDLLSRVNMYYAASFECELSLGLPAHRTVIIARFILCLANFYPNYMYFVFHYKHHC